MTDRPRNPESDERADKPREWTLDGRLRVAMRIALELGQQLAHLRKVQGTAQMLARKSGNVQCAEDLQRAIEQLERASVRVQQMTRETGAALYSGIPEPTPNPEESRHE